MAAAAPSSVHVKVKVAQGEQNSAVLAAFPQGTPAEVESIPFRIYANPQHKSSAALLGADDVLEYLGAVGPSSSGVCRYAVGVFQPKKGRLGLFPVPNPFTVSQQVKGREGSAGTASLTSNSQEYVAQREELVEKFGSTKRKRMLASARAKQIDVKDSQTTAAVQDAMALASKRKSSAIDDIDIEQQTKDASEQLKQALLPPYNPDTKDVTQVYPIPDVVGGQLNWEALDPKPLVKVAKHPGNIKDDQWPAVIAHRLRSLKAADLDKSQMKRLARLTLYLYHLLQFGSNNGRRPQAEQEQDPTFMAPDWLLDHFEAQFVQLVPNSRRQQLRADRLRCHICVLAVLAFGFSVEEESLRALAADLKLTLSQLLVYFREIGCGAKGVGQKAVVLKAPLQLPGLQRRQAKKQKTG